MTLRHPEARIWTDEIIVDSFAGGGGASKGIELELGRSPDIAINHDAEAIALHKANHTETEHHTEDVWKVDPVEACRGRRVGLMWLSPDCTHHSKARGGKPRKKKIRGLAWTAVRWAAAVRPRVIVLENVEEFQTWGPLLDSGLPDKTRAGQTFRAFVGKLRRLGYQVEWRELRACDFGAPTIRRRLFLIARSDGQPIVWPKPTHGKGTAYPWRTAAECIEWSVGCPSIFGRKKPLAENTMRRIARGLRKFVIEAPNPFIIAPTLIQVGYGEREGQAPRVPGLDKPLDTVVGGGRKHALVAAFLAKHFSENGEHVQGASMLSPAPTVTAVDHSALVSAFMVEPGQRHGRGENAATTPMTTVVSKDRHALVRAFMVAYFGNEKDGGSLLDPMRTVTSKDRFGLVTVEGVEYQIADIGMRMLEPRELYRAQGFPDSYKIDIPFTNPATGKTKPMTKTAQVRMVGNSVSPNCARAIVAANCPELARQERVA